MADGERTGISEVEVLVSRADCERDRFWGLTAMADAHVELSAARVADLGERHQAAAQRWSDAEERFTRTQQDGEAARIAAAERDAAYADYGATAAKVVTEMRAILTERLDRTGRQLDALQRAADADAAVLDALRRHPL